MTVRRIAQHFGILVGGGRIGRLVTLTFRTERAASRFMDFLDVDIGVEDGSEKGDKRNMKTRD